MEKSLYAQSNDLCNSLDSQMRELTKDLKGRVCEISENNIYEQMHTINQAFKLVSNARTLLLDLRLDK